MIDFIICEDDKNTRDRIINIVNEYMLNKGLSFNIGFVSDGTEGAIDYIKKNRNKKNIYILDIELKDNHNGMILAKEIRKYDSNGEIIFLTSHTTMVMYVFKYKLKALDFIDKQENIEKRLISNFDNILNSLSGENSKKRFIEVKSGTRIYKLNLDEIINIQTTSINGKLRISTNNAQIEFYGQLKDIIKNLDGRFYRSHRACIVNKDYIRAINKEKYNLYILMKNGEKSLLSRNYIKGLENKDD